MTTWARPSWPDGWRSVTVGTGITAYLRDVGGLPVVTAADHGQWRIDYANHLNGWPRQVRIRSVEAPAGSAGSPVTVDITAALEQLEINTTIDEKAFIVAPPAGAIPITLDDLRAVAPLRGSS